MSGGGDSGAAAADAGPRRASPEEVIKYTEAQVAELLSDMRKALEQSRAL